MSHDEKSAARREVAAAYAKALDGPATPCGCGAPGGKPAPKGVAAKLAGYAPEELAALPEDAVVHSFGCGNPLAFAEVAEGEVVLDLGSGAGIDLLLAARRVGPAGRVIGVDMTEEMISRARENAAAAGLENVEVRRGIIEELPVESASVDWVISNCVINLSPEKPTVFAEIARVLRPGGRMIVADIVAEELPDWVRESPALRASCVGRVLGEREYLEGLCAAGLEEVEVRERLVYKPEQILAIVRSDLSCADAAVQRHLAGCGEKELGELARSLAGKVWHAMFHARKPA